MTIDTSSQLAIVRADRDTEGAPRREPPKDERLAAHRHALIAAAAVVFAEHGRANASVAAILARCSLGRGTFYRCFSNLDEAFIAVQQEAVSRLHAHVGSRVSACTDPEGRLVVGISAYFEALVVLGDFARVLYVERPRLDAHRDLRQQSLGWFIGMFRDGLAEAYAAGIIASVPNELAIYTVVAGLEAVAVRLLEGHASLGSRAEVEQTMVEVCIRALCVPPGPAGPDPA